MYGSTALTITGAITLLHYCDVVWTCARYALDHAHVLRRFLKHNHKTDIGLDGFKDRLKLKNAMVVLVLSTSNIKSWYC